jgi:integrase
MCVLWALGHKPRHRITNRSRSTIETRLLSFGIGAEIAVIVVGFRPDIQRITAAKGNRHGRRDALMILLAYRHGLRAAEVVALRWEQVDLVRAVLHVNRVKNGTPSTHPLTGRELRALRQHQRDNGGHDFVFVSERGAPFDAPGFSRMVERTGKAANLGIKAHAHMLRHGCGYKLANDGHDTRAIQDWLGHRSIQHTVRYTELSQTRFKDFWRA